MPDSINTEEKFAPTAWGQNAGAAGQAVELEVPSGQICLARRPGIQGLMKAGILHDADPFIGLVQQHEERVTKGKGKKAKKDPQDASEIARELFNDPAKMESLFHLLDRVICHCVLKPEVQMTPDDITRRESGVIYADMIELEDKMFLFTWAMGGAADVAQFRAGLSRTMEGLESLTVNEGNAAE